MSGVYAFKTREGRIGVLETVSANPSSVTVRYKLVQNSSKPQTAHTKGATNTSDVERENRLKTLVAYEEAQDFLKSV